MSGRAPSSLGGLLSSLLPTSWSPRSRTSQPAAASAVQPEASTSTPPLASSVSSSRRGQAPPSQQQHIYGEEIVPSSVSTARSQEMMGEEIPLPRSQEPIASTGFYGSSRAVDKKGKGKAKATLEDEEQQQRRTMMKTPSSSSFHQPLLSQSQSQLSAPSSSRELVMLPVRVYRCPTIDQPLYTVNKANKTIHIHATDADACYWPAKHTTRKRGISEAHSLGIQTWHEPVKQGTKQLDSWKQKCGQGLATLLKLEGDPKSWTLADWPEGYKMFVHHQYDKPAAFFYYVIGSTFHGKRRFKTSKEFVKHLAWLCAFGDDLSAQCGCKFCVKDFQTNGLPRDAIVQRSVQIAPEFLKLPRPAKRARTDAGPPSTSSTRLPPSSRMLQAQSSFASSVGSVGSLPSRNGNNSSMHSSPMPSISAIEVVIPVTGSSRPGTPTIQSIPHSQTRVVSTTESGSAHLTSAPSHLSSLGTHAPPRSGNSHRSVFDEQALSQSEAWKAIDTVSDVVFSMPPQQSSFLPYARQQAELPQQFPALGNAAFLSATITAEQLKQSRGKGGKPRRSALSDGAADSADTGDNASVQMTSDTSNLGKRKRNQVDYYIPTIEEFSVIDAKAAELAAAAAVAENVRPARSTRNNKSMRESTPPQLRPPSGPMYNGPFIHKKRCDDLKVHSAPYREHEIVWYKLPNPPTSPDNPDLCIKYWPCEINVKALQVETHHIEQVELENELGEMTMVPQPVNIQYYRYSVELFGVEKGQQVACKVEDLLPWAAYGTPANLNNRRCQDILRPQNSALERLDDKADFADVLTTWTWARHWALAIRSHFAPFGFYLDRDTIKRMRKRKKLYYANGKGPSVIVNGKRRKARSRAQILAREKEMEQETEMIKTTSQYYQGIWFGCEKFWVGELVRLAGTYTRSDRSKDKTAHLQLYRSNKSGSDKTQVVALDGLAFDEESEEKPAFFQVTHIYREPSQDGQGNLLFDGIFYQAVHEDLFSGEKKPPSLFDGLSGTFDISDASSDQEYLIDPLTGEKQVDLGVATMYRRKLLPPPPSGYVFRALRNLDGSLDNDNVSTIHPSMIAGRYYPPGVLFSEQDDRATRKLVRACSGKSFRPETQARPTHASVNRHLMIRASSRTATRDMKIFFERQDWRQRKDRKAVIEVEPKRRQGGRSQEGSPTPTVASQRKEEMRTPVSHRKRPRSPPNAAGSASRAPRRASKDRSKQTTVTEGITDDSD